MASMVKVNVPWIKWLFLSVFIFSVHNIFPRNHQHKKLHSWSVIHKRPSIWTNSQNMSHLWTEIKKKQHHYTEIGSGWKVPCRNPCNTHGCKKAQAKISTLIDESVDPCQDFFQFSCKESGRGTNPPSLARKKLLGLADLILEDPAKHNGFNFIHDFYQSCICVHEVHNSSEWLCGFDYENFFRYYKKFASQSYWPVITRRNWTESTDSLFGGLGWSWYDFAAATINKQSLYLVAFQYITSKKVKEKRGNRGTDHFISNVFFTPLIDQTIKKEQYDMGDLSSKIYIVPMTIPYFFKKKDEAKIIKYKEFMMAVVQSFGAQKEIVLREMERVLQLERELAEISKHEYSTDDDWKQVTISELYSIVPSVDWTEYINKAFNGDQRPFEKIVERTDTVYIPINQTGKENNKRDELHLMKAMETWIKNINKRDQANLIIWRMFSKFLNNFLHMEDIMYYGIPILERNIFNLIGNIEDTRENNCLEQIQTLFPYVEDDMIISHYLSEEEIKDIEGLFKEIKIELGRLIIAENTWMDKRAKHTAMKKLISMKINIGRKTDETGDLETLKQKITKDDYIGNILATGNFFWKNNVKQLHEPKDGFLDEADSNAYYSYTYNEVQVNTALVENIEYNLDMPRPLTYGSFVTWPLGHELMHAFDSLGKKRNEDGNIHDWWEPRTLEAYAEKVACIKEQYSSFAITDKGKHYKTTGDNTIRENIADNGGLKIGYRAFKNNQEKIFNESGIRDKCLKSVDMSPEQLFWVAYAQRWCLAMDNYLTYPSYADMLKWKGYVHSPSPWRVNTAVSNMPEFAKDFNCPKGSKLNPPDKMRCIFW